MPAACVCEALQQNSTLSNPIERDWKFTCEGEGVRVRVRVLMSLRILPSMLSPIRSVVVSGA